MKTNKWKTISYEPKHFPTGSFGDPFLELEITLPQTEGEIRLLFYTKFPIEPNAATLAFSSMDGKAINEKNMQALKPSNLFKVIGDIWNPT